MFERSVDELSEMLQQIEIFNNKLEELESDTLRYIVKTMFEIYGYTNDPIKVNQMILITVMNYTSGLNFKCTDSIVETMKEYGLVQDYTKYVESMRDNL